ncbi:hypothetical protein AB0M28_31400 [Streptomyces sp. NPDC051940]|uniref:hypothetical protein n=1 Tax=Streptomyces sp. NPDC051940 TaxID=3155675 RepID=UPI003429F6D9
MLALELTTNATAPVDHHSGVVTVGGTITCTKAASVTVRGHVIQYQKHAETGGTYTTSVACTPGAPVAWSAQVESGEPGIPFEPGAATLRSRATATDLDYPATADTGQQNTEITLIKS